MESEKSITGLVGAYLPQPLVDYLNLYAFACDRTKSDLLRDAFEKWYEIRKEALSAEVLMGNIQAKVQQKWVVHKLDNVCNDQDTRALHAEFNAFKKRVLDDLSKKINKSTATAIINELEI